MVPATLHPRWGQEFEWGGVKSELSTLHVEVCDKDLVDALTLTLTLTFTFTLTLTLIRCGTRTSWGPTRRSAMPRST